MTLKAEAHYQRYRWVQFDYCAKGAL